MFDIMELEDEERNKLLNMNDSQMADVARWIILILEALIDQSNSPGFAIGTPTLSWLMRFLKRKAWRVGSLSMLRYLLISRFKRFHRGCAWSAESMNFYCLGEVGA